MNKQGCRGASRGAQLSLVLWLLVQAALLPATPVTAAPLEAALATPDFFGLVGRDPWYEFDDETGQPRRPFQETMARQVAASGARWIRLEFHTAYLTTGPARVAGTVAFAETDLFINELAPKYGLKVLGLLNSGIISDQPPYNYKVRDLLDPSRRERYITAFVARAQEIAQHYAGRMAAYEIFNEPNINAELTVTTNPLRQEIPPEIFADLLTRTFSAIRAVDPTASIVLGGLLKGYPIENGSRYTTDYLRAVYSAPAVVNYRAMARRLPFDGVGLHPYPNTALPRAQWLGDTLGLVSQIGTVMRAAGDPGQIWITEVGVKATPAAQPVAPATTDESFQATWLRDLMTALATTYAAQVARTFWFKYEDFPPGNPTETWGLVRLEESGGAYQPDGLVRRVKPGYLALHDLAYVAANTWYFAEGYTATTFDEFLTIQNAGTVDALVVVTYLPTGAAPVVRSELVKAQSRATLVVHELPTGIGRGWPVAARVQATAPVLVERPMYFSYGAGLTGGHVVVGTTAPATRWYFAEGYTGAGFDQYLTLQNPAPTATTVTVTYLFADGSGRLQRTLSLPAQSRQTVVVHDVVGRGRAVAMIVDSSGGVGIVAERPIYFSYLLMTATGLLNVTGGHVAMGVREPARSWWFAEGYTGDGFDQYFAILNPNPTVATVTLTYYLSGGRQQQRTIQIGANQRGTVRVHDSSDPGGLGRGEANGARLASDLPVVAERPMYFRYDLRDGRPADGGHTVVGTPTLATRYQFAEGYTGDGFDEFLTLLNPNGRPNRLRFVFQLANGGTLIRERTVAANSRETLPVHDSTEGVGPGQAVSATVTSLDALPFLAERPMYFSYGLGWTGGHVAIGYPG